MNSYKQKFYSALKDTFIGTPIKGESGFVNIMQFRSQYFDEVQPLIKELEDEYLVDFNKDQAYEKLYTFFKSYLNETGTPFFNETQIHKNMYDKIYSDRDDVSLFWKTKNLYYVKSEALYDDLETEINNVTFKFDASKIKHSKGNEKKNLEFYLVEVEDGKKKELTFRVQYQEQVQYSRVNKLLKCETSDLKKIFIEENFPKNIENPNIKFLDNGFDYSFFSNQQSRYDVIVITNNEDITETVTVEVAPSKLDDVIGYLNYKTKIVLSSEDIEKAFSIYRRQNEVDYFIHKDAEKFLKEQFDIYMYNWLFNDLDTEFDEKTVRKIQNIKIVAYKVIEYIAKFEDELKAIWEKPKFVRNCNYVFTLDRLFKKKEDGSRDLYDKRGIKIVKEIIKSEGFKKQIEEWKTIFQEETNEGILIKNSKFLCLNEKYRYLPIDTKFFGELRYDILSSFENLENNLDGVLIKSDNWQAMNTIMPKYKGTVDTTYIDPPFNTDQHFDSYKDKFLDSTWLTMIDDRLQFVRDLLKTSGNFFLHLDENGNHYGKLLLEKIFSSNITEVVFDTNATKDPEADLYGYKSFGSKFVLKHSTVFHCTCENSKFRKLFKINSNSTKLNIGWLDLIGIPEKKSPKSLKDFKFVIEKYNEKGNLENEPIKVEEKIYPLGDLWYDIYSFTQSEMRTSENISFLTQKPENLIRRIIQSTSYPGDTVMDFFSGSGTTIAVAHKLGRKWVGVEIGDQFNESYLDQDGKQKMGILGRLKNVMRGDKKFYAIEKNRRSHLSIDINWQGGGAFKYYELEQYEDTLSKSRYKGNIENISEYSFMQEEKLLEAIIINKNKEIIEIDFSKLYKDIDIAETISNLIGKKIKKLEKDKVTYEDDTVVDLHNITLEKYPFLKPLIWWRSK